MNNLISVKNNLGKAAFLTVPSRGAGKIYEVTRHRGGDQFYVNIYRSNYTTVNYIKYDLDEEEYFRYGLDGCTDADKIRLFDPVDVALELTSGHSELISIFSEMENGQDPVCKELLSDCLNDLLNKGIPGIKWCSQKYIGYLQEIELWELRKNGAGLLEICERTREMLNEQHDE